MMKKLIAELKMTQVKSFDLRLTQIGYIELSH